MRAREFITRSKIVDRNGIQLDVSIDGATVDVRPMINGRQVGYVVFDRDGQTLVPDDLAIDEEYRGKGIAKIMYDYLKEIGFTIKRSSDQTKAGKAFWDKNKGQEGALWEQDVAEDEEPVIKLADNGRERAKAWIQKVYELYPSTFQNNHVMIWGEGPEQQMAMFELTPSFSKRGAVEVKWISAHPLRQGVGSRAMKELQRLAHEDGIGLTLFPWAHGQVSPAKLTKFYKGQGFKPTAKGAKTMAWEPAAKELTELFEPTTALPLEWSSESRPVSDGYHPRQVTLAQHIDEEGKSLTINFFPYANNNIVDIMFDYGGTIKITGGGNAVQIFATVLSAINKYINAKHPNMISFSASEPSRIKLYQHLVKRLSGNYELLSPKQYPADEELKNAQVGVGTFFLLRKKK